MVSRRNYSQEYGQAEKAYLESNFAKAAEIIDHLAEEFPYDPNILLLRGHIYCYGFQNYNIAIQQYKSVLKLTKEQDLLDFALSGIEQIEQLKRQSENFELSSKNSTQESLNQTKMTNNPQGDDNKKIVVTQGFIDKLIDKIGKILKEQHALVERDEEQAEEIESLLNKISSIENDFEELTKSLARGSYPLKLARSIKVASSSIKPHIVPVDLTKAQLIATYNELVAVLFGYIIPVTLTPDSYRGSNSDEIILETTVKGNYWAIATLENKQHKYWLVPNNNISFNIHKLKTVESLFQLKGDYDSPNSDFILEEPAILSLLPNNKQWKLLQPGVLLFGTNSKSVSSQLKPSQNVADDEQSKINKQILSSLTAFQSKVEQLDNKIAQLELQSEISHQAYQREKKEWLSEKETLNQQLGKIAELKSQLSNCKTKIVNSFDNYNLSLIESDHHVNNDSNPINEPQEGSLYDEIGDRNLNKIKDLKNKDHIKINLTTQISQFRQAYTQDLKLIQGLIIAKVAISVETLEQITFDQPNLIFLENTSHGKYWIIDYSGNYFLIPSEIQHITDAKETSLTIVRLLFHLSGYYPQYSSYHLIRPAIVTKVSTNQ